MTKLIGWLLTVGGLIAMIGFGFTTLMYVFGLTAGNGSILGVILYVAATTGAFFVWKYGGKLRSRK